MVIGWIRVFEFASRCDRRLPLDTLGTCQGRRALLSVLGTRTIRTLCAASAQGPKRQSFRLHYQRCLIRTGSPGAGSRSYSI